MLDDAIDHIERFIGMYGEKIVALGCDFDGCDQLPVGIEGLFYDNAFAFIQKML